MDIHCNPGLENVFHCHYFNIHNCNSDANSTANRVINSHQQLYRFKCKSLLPSALCQHLQLKLVDVVVDNLLCILPDAITSKLSSAILIMQPKTKRLLLVADGKPCLRADVSYFLCCTRKRDVCVTPWLIVFQRPSGRLFSFA